MRKAHPSPSSRSHTSDRQPTGKTSNAILDGLKRLGRNSVLFKESKAAGVKARGGITKIGQGGTLDPLADGVLGQSDIPIFVLCWSYSDLWCRSMSTAVVGLGRGTKELNRFLLCSKVRPPQLNQPSDFNAMLISPSPSICQEYRTTAILGCSTDSFDSEGAIVDTAPWEHLTREDVEAVLDRFRGEIMQMPPV